MAVARQVASGDFFLDVNLQNGFTFNGTRLPVAGDVTLTTAGGGTIGAVTIFNGGTAGSSSVRFRIPVTGSFSTAPVFTVATAAWTVNDVAGYLSGAASVTTQIEIRTYDANTGVEIDGGVNTANFITAVNALAATVTTTTAVVDTAAGSGRLRLVATAPDTITQDQGAALNLTVGNATAALNVHKNDGTNYTVAATDSINIRVTGNLSGIKYVYYNYLTGTNVLPEIRKTVAAADVTNGYVDIAVPGTNASIATLANASVSPALAIEVDGTTQLTKRAFTIGVEATCAYNAANNRTAGNALVASGTALSTWDINGTVLLLNWTSANTAVYKSRIYLFNETSVANATVLVKLFQIPISANTTAGAQIGSQVQLNKTLGAYSGMTIRLEDVIAAGAFAATDLQGPDGSYNVAVEITVYTGVPGGSVTVGPVTGYGQTFNAVGMPSVVFGTVPLSKIQ